MYVFLGPSHCPAPLTTRGHKKKTQRDRNNNRDRDRNIRLVGKQLRFLSSVIIRRVVRNFEEYIQVCIFWNRSSPVSKTIYHRSLATEVALDKKQIRAIFLYEFKARVRGQQKLRTKSTMHLAGILLRHVRCNGGSINFPRPKLRVRKIMATVRWCATGLIRRAFSWNLAKASQHRLAARKLKENARKTRTSSACTDR